MVLVDFGIFEDETEDAHTLGRGGQGDGEFLGHAPQDRFVNVLDPIRRAEDEDPLDFAGGIGGGETVPVGHEFGLDHAAGFVFATPARTEDSINLVYKDYARLKFPGEGEDGVDEFVGVAVPLFCQSGDVEVYECGATFVGEGFCEHGLSTTGGTVEEDA